MELREIIRDYFNFSRKERIGIITVVVLIVIIWFSPSLVAPFAKAKRPVGDTSWIAQLKDLLIVDSLEIKITELQVQKNYYNEKKEYAAINDDANDYSFQKSTNSYFNKEKTELFYFDPNTLSPAGWQKLGVRNKTIKTIQNYLSKGGHFYKPGDLEKVYGLHRNEYERLAPYIRIEQKETKSSEAYISKPAELIKSQPAKVARYSVIDVNTADTAAFITLPGIGSKLAARIVNFRDKLGGFYSIDQVKETFGLPDSTFQKIRQYLKLENSFLRKININSATVDELRAHPYIKYNIANPIIAYRNEHGAFAKLEDIKKVMAVTDDVYRRIVIYLTID
jgi:competence ComEA-like helix-hairpin-helix protein